MKINVAEHISTLLYEQDRVIIPNLGGFCATYKPANTEKYGNVSPPTKEIYFDESLNFHDNVLIEMIVQKHEVSYKEALTEVESFVRDIKNNIGSKAIVISNVGRLYLDARNDIVLAPSSVNFLEDAFGLPKMNYYPITRNEEKAAILPVQQPVNRKKESSIKKFFLNFWNDPSAIGLMIIVLLIIIIVPLLSKLANPSEEVVNPMIIENEENVVDKNKTLKPFEETAIPNTTEEASVVPKETTEVKKVSEAAKVVETPKKEEKEINEKPETTTSSNNNEKVKETETPPTNETTSKNPTTTSATAKEYIVIIGNFSTQEYTNKALKQVRDAGYKTYARKLGTAKHRVGIALRCEPSEIDAKMVKIKEQFPGSWVMNRDK